MPPIFFSIYNTIDSDSDSDNSSFLDISSALPSLFPVLSELFSKASVTCTWHFIRVYIQAITLLELNIPYFEITAQTRISKA
jgi:hypothetical protein